MKVSFDVKRILLLDSPFEPDMLNDEQAVIGTIENEYVFMKKIAKKQMEELKTKAKIESNLGTYELIKKQYEDFQEQLKEMYQIERQILENLQTHCPHYNTYKVDDEFLGIGDDPYFKCKDCGKVLK